MDNCIIRIQETMDSLPKKEIKVAKYILENTQLVCNMTVSELSKASNCSTATIVRFCVAIGFKGYKEFTKAFYHDLVLANDSLKESIALNQVKTDNNLLASDICEAEIKTIGNSAKIMDVEKIKKAVDIINQSQKIYIYAMGESSIIARDLVYKLQRIGIDSQLFDGAHSQILSASILSKNDVALFISYSGENKDLINTIQLVNKRKATSISITRFSDNPLSRYATIAIRHSGNVTGKMPIHSRLIQMSTIEIVYAYLLDIRKDYYQKLLQAINFNVF